MLTFAFSLLLTRSFKPYRFRRVSDLDKTLDVQQCGIYVHIPFCRSLCSFCPYYKVPYEPNLVSRFANAVLREAEIVAAKNRGKQFGSLYFGGGTPALLLQDHPQFIFKLRQMLPVSGDLAVELHPSDVTARLADALLEAGVTMVSLGVQSFRPDLQENLGRKPVDSVSALEKLSSAGFEALDVDLIFGIPGQDDSLLVEDFKRAVEMGATQVSTYPFIDFTFAPNKRMPLSHKQKRRMLDVLCQCATDLGFERTSVWTFGRRGTRPYSSVTRENFVGLGPSATTLMRDRFLVNTLNLDDYLASSKNGASTGGWELEFTDRQRLMYWLFWSIYNMKIDSGAFQKYFGYPLEKAVGAEIKLATRLGLLSRNGSAYNVTSAGALSFHRVEQIYTRQYIDKTWRIARQPDPPQEIVLW